MNVISNYFQTLNPSPKFFPYLRKVLGLTLIQEVVIAIALQHSETPEIQSLALEDLQKQVPELIQNYVHSENSKKQNEGLSDSSTEVLHLILFNVLEESNRIEISSQLKEKLLKNLRRDFPRELVPVVLAPLLYPGDGEAPQVSQKIMGSTQMVILKI